MVKLMMQDPEGTDRVVSPKTRLDEALSSYVQEHEERVRKTAKHVQVRVRRRHHHQVARARNRLEELT